MKRLVSGALLLVLASQAVHAQHHSFYGFILERDIDRVCDFADNNCRFRFGGEAEYARTLGPKREIALRIHYSFVDYTDDKPTTSFAPHKEHIIGAAGGLYVRFPKPEFLWLSLMLGYRGTAYRFYNSRFPDRYKANITALAGVGVDFSFPDAKAGLRIKAIEFGLMPRRLLNYNYWRTGITLRYFHGG